MTWAWVKTPLKWLWLKIQQEGLRRFWSMFPLTRVPFWYRFFEPQPNGWCNCPKMGSHRFRPTAKNRSPFQELATEIFCSTCPQTCATQTPRRGKKEQDARGNTATRCGKRLNSIHPGAWVEMAMGHKTISVPPFWGGWTPMYHLFDVHPGHRGLTHSHMSDSPSHAAVLNCIETLSIPGFHVSRTPPNDAPRTHNPCQRLELHGSKWEVPPSLPSSSCARAEEELGRKPSALSLCIHLTRMI